MSFCVWVDPESNEDMYSANLFGQIYLQLDDVFFPDRGWGDFVCIVLSWWVRALGSLDNKPSKLGFMDGPFEVRIAVSTSDSVVCSCIRRNSKADTTVATAVMNLDALKGSVKQPYW